MSNPQSPLRTTEQLNVALAERYEVERQIGHGGMATVYLARDVKHNRKVALKVLNPELGEALGPERFLAEISVTANLHHPHLLPLFDSGEAGGMLFYVMPYVEGQTLRERLDREGQLAVGEAIRIANAVAGALDYAHRQGVIHRDLKPENILLHEQQPLVMDFGIALAVSNAGGERLTQIGMSLGTPQYMSPEQATGDRQVDARTDIYSLAAVLYEMLSGKPPHTGNTVQAVIAKVIMDKPASVRATREMVPQHLEAAVLRGLAKLPADRFATAMEFGQAITGEHALVVREHTGYSAVAHESALPAASRSKGVKLAALWLALLSSAVALGAWGATLARGSSDAERQPLVRFLVALPDSVAIPPIGRALALSGDGTRLAIAGSLSGPGSQLLVRRMNGVNVEVLPGTESARSPVFSPNGSSLLFSAGAAGRLMKISSDGGAALPVAESSDGQHSWGEGDKIVFRRGGSLWIVAAGAGAARLLASPDTAKGERALSWPDILPGGQFALVAVERKGVSADSSRLAVVSLADGKVKELGVAGMSPRYAAPGHMIFADAIGQLWAVPFSLRTRRVSGERVLLADLVHVDSTGVADFAVSRTGALVYSENAAAAQRRGGQLVSLAIVDSKGNEKSLSPRRGDYSSPRVSQNGARIALTIRDASNRSDVWIYEIDTQQLSPLTRDGLSAMPEWHPDGRHIVFRYDSVNPPRFFSQPWDHSGAAKLFATSSSSSGRGQSVSLARPGGYMAMMLAYAQNSGQRQNISIAPMSRPDSLRQIVGTSASETVPRVSPNSKWLAYTSNESGTFQIWVNPIPGPGPRVPVSIEHGVEPVWSRDGKLLYYLSQGRLLAAHVDESSGFRVTKQDTLFAFQGERHNFVVRQPPLNGPSTGFYDVFPNGDFVVLARSGATGGGRTNIIATLHWSRALAAGTAGSAQR